VPGWWPQEARPATPLSLLEHPPHQSFPPAAGNETRFLQRRLGAEARRGCRELAGRKSGSPHNAGPMNYPPMLRCPVVVFFVPHQLRSRGNELGLEMIKARPPQRPGLRSSLEGSPLNLRLNRRAVNPWSGRSQTARVMGWAACQGPHLAGGAVPGNEGPDLALGLLFASPTTLRREHCLARSALEGKRFVERAPACVAWQVPASARNLRDACCAMGLTYSQTSAAWIQPPRRSQTWP
jgi:hypothetical protein